MRGAQARAWNLGNDDVTMEKPRRCEFPVPSSVFFSRNTSHVETKSLVGRKSKPDKHDQSVSGTIQAHLTRPDFPTFFWHAMVSAFSLTAAPSNWLICIRPGAKAASNMPHRLPWTNNLSLFLSLYLEGRRNEKRRVDTSG